MAREPSALQILLDEFRDYRQESREDMASIERRLASVESDIKSARLLGYWSISVVTAIGAFVGWCLKTVVAFKEAGRIWWS